MSEHVRSRAAFPTFSERLTKRQALWWDARWPRRRQTLGDAVHWLRERRALRSRDDPDAAWHCCAFWPRTLINKWNGREFAARHGCQLPALYWTGSDHSKAPIESLPEEFVIRPIWGQATRDGAVVAAGKELLHGLPASRSDIRARLPRTSRLRRPAPILIEELIKPEDGRVALPLECQCHTFGARVAAVQVIERRTAMEVRSRFYTPDWEPMPDPMATSFPVDERLRDRPGCLERMLELAGALGASIGTYMRIDFFLTRGGCVFNEFSSVPRGGHQWCTPYCDELFGALWAEICPDAT